MLPVYIGQRIDQAGEEFSISALRLDLDPAAKALRGRLANLDQQMGSERATGQRAALAEAQQQLTSAREAADTEDCHS